MGDDAHHAFTRRYCVDHDACPKGRVWARNPICSLFAVYVWDSVAGHHEHRTSQLLHDAVGCSPRHRGHQGAASALGQLEWLAGMGHRLRRDPGGGCGSLFPRRVGFMRTRRSWLAINALVIGVMLVWGLWLLGQGKTIADYTLSRLGDKPISPTCRTFGMDAPAVSKFGWSQEPTHAWSDRRDAYIALKFPAMPRGGAVDMDVIALLGERATFRIGQGPTYSITSARQVRLPFASRQAGPIVIKINVENPKRPSGEDRRWLGIAIKELRVVSASCKP